MIKIASAKWTRPLICLFCVGLLANGTIPAFAGSDSAPVDPAEAREVVARALADQGLSEAEIEERLTKLTDEDIRYFAEHREQIQSAGNVPDYIWLLLGIFLGVLILTSIF